MHSNNRRRGKNIFKCLPTPSIKKKNPGSSPACLQLRRWAIFLPLMWNKHIPLSLSNPFNTESVTKGNPVSSKLLTHKACDCVDSTPWQGTLERDFKQFTTVEATLGPPWG